MDQDFQAGWTTGQLLAEAGNSRLPIGDHPNPSNSILSSEADAWLTVLGFSVENGSGGLAQCTCTEGVIALQQSKIEGPDAPPLYSTLA